MKVYLMAHPVSGDVLGNIASAKRWLRWLSDHHAYQDAAIICPWLTWLEVLPLRDGDPADRELGLRRCEEVAARCNAVILVGGRISSGMRREADACGHEIDMTPLGPVPPDGGGA